MRSERKTKKRCCESEPCQGSAKRKNKCSTELQYSEQSKMRQSKEFVDSPISCAAMAALIVSSVDVVCTMLVL